jgi:CubicO group peptidase (beta-lactamase class C family)
VIVHNGQLVTERYAEGFSSHTPLIGWSMTKSLTNAMVGRLAKQGKLDIQQPAPVTVWKNDERSKITLNDLLHASSGLTWEENYAGPSDATNMLFKRKDAGLVTVDKKPEFAPGTVFEYSSGTSNLISRIVRETIGDHDYYNTLYNEIFYKIGMYSLVIEPDAGGTFVGSSFSFANARDWARFGLLYLNDGVWNGERILPEGWVAYTVTPAPAAKRGEYGAQFWLNAGEKGNPSNRMYPDAPTDLYWADGFEGQNVFVIPSKNLVIVKLGLSQGDYLDDNKFLAGIISAVK